MSVRVIVGDCLESLRGMEAESVQCCVTSPPYYGLRDYGHPGQLGLESTPELYVSKMVEVFREVRRVLRNDGVLWLNIGDSYAAQRGGTSMPAQTVAGGIGGKGDIAAHRGMSSGYSVHRNAAALGLKHKDLMGIPWMLAFALRTDGWYLRSDIIWHKPNPMPESVTDRPTKSHEYLFLLSKSERYYYDADAIKEPLTESSVERLSQPTIDLQVGSDRVPGKTNGNMKAVGKLTKRSILNGGGHSSPQLSGRGDLYSQDGLRNKRSVWSVTTQGFSGAHFATMPPALVEPCIKAGSKQGDTVLDPFGGAGTTGLVADRLNRNAILCELNPEYADLARKRIQSDNPLFTDVA